MRNVLFLLDYYLPNPSINGVCCENVIKDLIKHGIKVYIGAFRNDSLKNINIIDGQEIFSVWNGVRLTINNSWKVKVQGYIRWMMPSRYPSVQNKSITNSIVFKAKKVIVEKNIDTLIAVHIPVETLIAGVELKNEFPCLKTYAYMLDPLAGGFVPRFLPKWYTNKRNRIWEKRIFRFYDKVILMKSSYSYHEMYNKADEWYNKVKYLDVPLLTGIVENDSIGTRFSTKTVISYCGSLEYPRRNVKYILDLIKAQNNRDLLYYFVGNTNHPELFENCPENVVYLGQVSHEEVIDLLKHSNILLNLGVRVSSAISGKIFEYMTFGKPIISTFSINDEACIPYLEKYPLSLLLDERMNPDKQVKVLNDFIEKNKSLRIPVNKVKSIFSESTPEAFSKILIEGGNVQ